MTKIRILKKTKIDYMNAITIEVIDLHNCKRLITYSPTRDNVNAAILNKRTGDFIPRIYKMDKLPVEKLGEDILDILEDTYIELYPEYFDEEEYY